MKRKKYITKLNFAYAIKNKLHKAILKMVQNSDRLVIDEDDLKKFQALFLAGLNQLNAMYPRCRACEFSWEFNRITGDYYLSFGGQQICDFALYHGFEKVNS